MPRCASFLVEHPARSPHAALPSPGDSDHEGGEWPRTQRDAVGSFSVRYTTGVETLDAGITP